MSWKSVFVGARSSQMIGTTKKAANAKQDDHRDDAVGVASREHQSTSNSFPRQTSSTATSRPITRRSTEIAAASLKLSCWNAR